jgi:hypothetical protein
MTEGLEHVGLMESDHDIETVAVAGAAAVQRLIADRTQLRARLSLQEQELAASRAAQDDLRRRLTLLHQRYIDLARKVVGQLEQFDVAIREVLQDSRQPGPVNGDLAKRQFDSNGVPIGPQLMPKEINGANGKIPLPIEP